ncbi:hypothetical protein G6F50_016082 [Rhizopus delemar]|uniref:Fumarylacetoacetase-like C-terminal domain-containing protein n=1 Tax=Rhizopus delemar TaxID=936053 RepID=A0A9P6XUG3_9FUNG|nr:hypothetical protein G6F50_016082 [Rhizopus delemar]
MRFSKPAEAIVVGHDDAIPYPPATANLHHEVELVVAIGRDAPAGELAVADADALDALMAQLPKQLDGVPLQHALEVRNAAVHGPALVAAARRHEVALVIEDSDEAPAARPA